ncbi:hypothetical protein JCM6882_004971 [Rhodosporidiobolus microsporus]
MTIIDTLPDELLLHILALVDTPTPFSLRPSSSLSRCCLVSRRWRDIAQPLLYRAIVLREPPDLDPLQALPAAVLPLVQHARALSMKNLVLPDVLVADLESVPLPSSADNVLTTVRLGYRGGESPINQVQHLCLTSFDADSEGKGWSSADLDAFVAKLPSFRSLRTILLPLELKSPSPARASTALLGPFRTSILRHCKHEGVEVLWSDWPFEEGEEEQASWPREEFARWVRAKRAAAGAREE